MNTIINNVYYTSVYFDLLKNAFDIFSMGSSNKYGTCGKLTRLKFKFFPGKLRLM